MPKYLIHVGPHKTGTTYLQLRFNAAREQLSRGGIVYPVIWRASESQPGHVKLVGALRDGRIAELRSQFDAIERSNPDYILISAEDINHLPQPALERLHGLLRGRPATIIFYCRRWSELLPSVWQERVKHGSDQTFPEFFATQASDPHQSVVLNYKLRLDTYAKVFGRENIRLVSYSNLSDANIDLADHFFDNFLPKAESPIACPPDMLGVRPNTSLPSIDTEVIRSLNSFNQATGAPRSAALLVWYLANAARLDLANVISAIRANAATLSFSDASFAMTHIEKAVLTSYGDLLVQPFKPGALFEPRTSETVFFSQRYLTTPAIHRAIGDAYQAFRDRPITTL